jgi:hypothetical protein
MGFPEITDGRVSLDDSSMISAYFYRLNLTNPDPSKSGLPRLLPLDSEQLERVKTDLQHVLSREGPMAARIGKASSTYSHPRYSDRLQLMAVNTTSGKAILSEINFLLNVFTDYSIMDSTGRMFLR